MKKQYKPLEQKVLSVNMFQNPKRGISMFGGDKVTIIGERQVELSNKVKLGQYLYNIDNVETENGEPFVALKANIMLD